MPLEALRTLAAEQPGQLSGADGARPARCARPARLDEALQAFERAAALVPIATGDDSPHAQIAEIALEKKDTRARDRGAAGALMAADFDNVEAARQLASLLREDKRRPIRRRCARSTSASPRSIRSTPTRTRCSDAWRCSATSRTPRSREFQSGARARPGRSGGGATPISRRAISRAASAPKRRKQTLAALEIAPSYERAQDLLLKLADGAGRDATAPGGLHVLRSLRRCC